MLQGEPTGDDMKSSAISSDILSSSPELLGGRKGWFIVPFNKKETVSTGCRSMPERGSNMSGDQLQESPTSVLRPAVPGESRKAHEVSNELLYTFLTLRARTPGRRLTLRRRFGDLGGGASPRGAGDSCKWLLRSQDMGMVAFLPTFFMNSADMSMNDTLLLWTTSYRPRVETRSACYRGPEAQKCPKWLREGAKDVLVHVDQNLVALVQNRVALVQNRVVLVQDTLGRPSLQLVKTSFAPSPNHFGHF